MTLVRRKEEGKRKVVTLHLFPSFTKQSAFALYLRSRVVLTLPFILGRYKGTKKYSNQPQLFDVLTFFLDECNIRDSKNNPSVSQRPGTKEYQSIPFSHCASYPEIRYDKPCLKLIRI